MIKALRYILIQQNRRKENVGEACCLASFVMHIYAAVKPFLLSRSRNLHIALIYLLPRGGRSVEPLLPRLRDGNRCATSRIKSRLLSSPLLKIQEVCVTYSLSQDYISGFAKLWAWCSRNDRVRPIAHFSVIEDFLYARGACCCTRRRKHLRFLRFFFFICRCRFLGTHCIRAER